MKATTEINTICNAINRHIYSMDYQTETKVREYLSDAVFDDKLVLLESDSDNIADILRVNYNCIFDLLTEYNYAI